MAEWEDVPDGWEDLPEDFSGERMVQNIPSSAQQAAKDLLQPILHPVQTGKFLGNLFGSGYNRLSEAVGNQLPLGLQDYAQRTRQEMQAYGVAPQADTPDMVGQAADVYKNRYGSTEAALNTLETDPVGALMDASGLLTGGATIAARAPGMLGGAGRVGQRVGLSLDPLNMAKAPFKAAARGIVNRTPEGLPRDLYESSTKFSTTFDQGTREKLANTALEYQIMPTGKGIDKLNMIMDDIGGRVDSLVADATNQGKLIHKNALDKYIVGLKRELGGPFVDAKKDLKHIDAVVDAYKDHLRDINTDFLTPNDLLAIKRDVHRRVTYAKTYGRAKKGRDEAKKAIARAAKERIEDVADVRDLNREWGDLLELKAPLERATGRIDNRNLLSINAPLNIGAGSTVGGDIGAAIGTAGTIIGNPKVKARLALALHKARQGQVLDNMERMLLNEAIQQGMYQSGRAQNQ